MEQISPRLRERKFLSQPKQKTRQLIKLSARLDRVLVVTNLKYLNKPTLTNTTLYPVDATFRKEDTMFNLVPTSLLSTPPLSLLAQDGFDPAVDPIMNSAWNDFFQEMCGRLIGTGCIVLVIFDAVVWVLWLG